VKRFPFAVVSEMLKIAGVKPADAETLARAAAVAASGAGIIPAP
jgi:hypothetical protein